MTKAGEFRHSIVLQSPTGSRNAVGERSTSWTSVATVRAKIEPLTANQRFIAAQANSEVSHRVTVRYDSSIAAIDGSWRVKFGGRYFVIDGVRNIEERNKIIELLCKEGLKTE